MTIEAECGLPEAFDLSPWSTDGWRQMSCGTHVFRLQRTHDAMGMLWRAFENGRLAVPSERDEDLLVRNLRRLVRDTRTVESHEPGTRIPNRSRHRDALDAGLLKQEWLDEVIAAAGPHPDRRIVDHRHADSDGSTTIFWFAGRPQAIATQVRDDLNYTVLALETCIRIPDDGGDATAAACERDALRRLERAVRSQDAGDARSVLDELDHIRIRPKTTGTDT